MDAYRPLRLPTILIASPHLGGISTTLSAYESLLLRGYDIDALLCLEEEYYANWKYFSRWSEEKGIPFGMVRPPAAPPASADTSPEERQRDMEHMKDFYAGISDQDVPAGNRVHDVIARLDERHDARLAALDSLPKRTRDHVWWPFVQHSLTKSDSDVMVIDSALGDHFSVLRQGSSGRAGGPCRSDTASEEPRAESDQSLLVPTFDGSASWWTQCLGHANVDLTLAAAHASGRYGHVIFPNASNEPAVTLSERLLATVGKDWAGRVFLSDDGSTGMEVALKMALRQTASRLAEKRAAGPTQHAQSTTQRTELGVLGLRGSYHGDTIGAMDASEPSVYSTTVEWYRGRGFWLDAPLVKIEKGGKAFIRLEGEQWQGSAVVPEPFAFGSLNEIYDVEVRLADRSNPLVARYKEHIAALVEDARGRLGLTFGALVMEPIVMGAGGMLFVDPLFQRLLVEYARAPWPSSHSQQKALPLPLPVVFDEVFVGLYRLGHQTTSTLLGVKPDIACYAKILTGGLVPMAVTLASEEVFDLFLGEKKQDALLHGHSYTAHPIGSAVANKTLDLIRELDSNGVEWNQAKKSWAALGSSRAGHSSPSSGLLAERGIFSVWDKAFVKRVVELEQVDGVMAMGTVLVIYLRDAQNAGYQSTVSVDFLKRLRYPEVPDAGMEEHLAIHARPLGNTCYWMSSLNTPRSTLAKVEEAIWEALTRET